MFFLHRPYAAYLISAYVVMAIATFPSALAMYREREGVVLAPLTTRSRIIFARAACLLFAIPGFVTAVFVMGSIVGLIVCSIVWVIRNT